MLSVKVAAKGLMLGQNDKCWEENVQNSDESFPPMVVAMERR